MNQLQKVQLWVPGCHSKDGGVQTYSAFIARAMSEILPGAQLDVHSKNDLAPPASLDGAAHVHCTGKWPGKLRTIAFSASAGRRMLLDKPDFVLSTLVNFGPLARRFPVPYWLVAHGIDVWGKSDRALIEGMSGAQRILCVSRYTRRRLIEDQGFSPERLLLLPNTFDHSRFEIAAKPDELLKRHSLSADQPVILTVARLSPTEKYKGYDRVIDALPAIFDKVPNAHYIIVGKGNDSARIKEILKQRNLADRVTLTGFVPDEELPKYYNLCDAFVMPSKGEGFGIVFLEALASGKPVIAGNADGSPDPLLDGEIGVLVDPDDNEAIGEHIIRILTREHQKRMLFRPDVLREKVIEKFGYENFRETLRGHLQLVLGEVAA